MKMLAPFLDINETEAGCDEAGRGCLCGPVFAAAVILPRDFSNDMLDDSKRLTAKQRHTLREVIENDAVAFAVATASNEEIDRMNILNASILAMHRALDMLRTRPTSILVDGNRFKPYKGIKHTTIVKGDSKYASIAAASVLAKTYRDEFMDELDREFPQYGWKKNKGYPTKSHREAILKHGTTIHHRLTFNLPNGIPPIFLLEPECG